MAKQISTWFLIDFDYIVHAISLDYVFIMARKAKTK